LKILRNKYFKSLLSLTLLLGLFNCSNKEAFPIDKLNYIGLWTAPGQQLSIKKNRDVRFKNESGKLKKRFSGTVKHLINNLI